MGKKLKKILSFFQNFQNSILIFRGNYPKKKIQDQEIQIESFTNSSEDDGDHLSSNETKPNNLEKNLKIG